MILALGLALGASAAHADMWKCGNSFQDHRCQAAPKHHKGKKVDDEPYRHPHAHHHHGAPGNSGGNTTPTPPATTPPVKNPPATTPPRRLPRRRLLQLPRLRRRLLRPLLRRRLRRLRHPLPLRQRHPEHRSKSMALWRSRAIVSSTRRVSPCSFAACRSDGATGGASIGRLVP